MSIGNCGTSFKKLTIRPGEPFLRPTYLSALVFIRGLRVGPESGSDLEPKEAGNSDESGQVESGGRDGIPKGIDSPA